MSYKPVIGMEIHLQLNTKTKLFCRCLNEYAPNDPNKNICPFCTGQPGALPVLNKAAVKKAIDLGVAIGGVIPEKTRWDRKNYFYPDLPAGYQISQYDNPIVEGGKIDFFVENKDTGEFTARSVELIRAHLEADAGKLLHTEKKSLADYNRSGAPLIEVVTQPQIRSYQEAMSFVQELQLIARTLGISDADMEKGQMRFDCNISLQNADQLANGELPPYKVEIKNINSFRSLGRAIEYEIKRQTGLLEKGQTPDQETRGWRDDLNKSVSQRSKEEAHDYRYFPEPDLQILEIKRIELPDPADLPKLPQVSRQEYLDMGLNIQTANTFVTQPVTAGIFQKALDASTSITIDKLDFVKVLSNLITVNLLGVAAKEEVSPENILKTEDLVSLTELFAKREVNNAGLLTAIEIFAKGSESSLKEVLAENGLIQINDDTALEAFVSVVIEKNPEQVQQYLDGKVQVIGYLVGQCMKESKGRGNPEKFKQILSSKLAELSKN